MQSHRHFAQALVIVYLIFTFYTIYYLLVNTNTVEKQVRFDPRINEEIVPNDQLWNPWPERKYAELSDVLDTVKASRIRNVEIWGKAAIGQYLWEHVLGEEIEVQLNGLWNRGWVRFGSIEFIYQSGPGLVPATAPKDVENIVLVLNGREEGAVKTAKIWLDFMKNLTTLKKLAVLILGNEECDNHWIDKYKKQNGGVIDVLFIVYDSVNVDDKNVFQWPLGVATYRNFPLEPNVNAYSHRRYICNFAGTIHKGSSREKLMKILNRTDLRTKCTVLPRYKWQPSETESSLANYIKMLENSDLTLCPVGFNTECYRIYEAMACGSVPVVEDVRTSGQCAENPLRLLKKLKAPVIFVKSWDELPDIINGEEMLSFDEKLARRKEVMEWYRSFREEMKEEFVNVINNAFFGKKVF